MRTKAWLVAALSVGIVGVGYWRLSEMEQPVAPQTSAPEATAPASTVVAAAPQSARNGTPNDMPLGEAHGMPNGSDTGPRLNGFEPEIEAQRELVAAANRVAETERLRADALKAELREAKGETARPAPESTPPPAPMAAAPQSAPKPPAPTPPAAVPQPMPPPTAPAVWAAATPSSPSPAQLPAEADMSKANRRQIQEALRALGYYKGPVDGVLGRRTRTAIRHFQRDIKAAATGHLTADEATRLVTAG